MAPLISSAAQVLDALWKHRLQIGFSPSPAQQDVRSWPFIRCPGQSQAASFLPGLLTLLLTLKLSLSCFSAVERLRLLALQIAGRRKKLERPPKTPPMSCSLEEIPGFS